MAPFLASLCLAALRGQQETGLPECIDVTFRNRTAWNDHLLRPCSFYAEDPSTRCAQNTAAKVMCCACGGGTTNTKAAVVSTATTACYDFKAYNSFGVIVTWEDEEGYDCNNYKSYTDACESGDDHANLGMTANDACCACNGGFFDNSGSNDCVDKRFDNGTTWNDGHVSIPETCADYMLESCAAHGYEDYGSGKAIDMCCVCGGGTQSTADDDDDDDALVIGLSVGGGVLAVALGAWAYRTYGNSNSKSYEAVLF